MDVFHRERYRSLSGIEPDTAAKGIAELVDFTYFPSPSNLKKIPLSYLSPIEPVGIVHLGIKANKKKKGRQVPI